MRALRGHTRSRAAAVRPAVTSIPPIPMPLFALTIFASAFLLFLVQPIIAKQILPWFGGSAAVWTTCLVFFQTALLAGYAYADLVVRRLALRNQAMAARARCSRSASSRCRSFRPRLLEAGREPKIRAG